MPCFFPRLTGQDRSVKGRWGQREVGASGRALGDPGQETRHLQARPALRDVPSLPSDILVFSGLRASVGLEYKFAGCFTKQHLGHIFFTTLQTSDIPTELLSISQLFYPVVPWCGAPRNLHLKGVGDPV